MVNLRELWESIVADGKITVEDVKLWLRKGGSIITVFTRGAGKLTSGAKAWIDKNTTTIGDIWKALPASLKILAGLGTGAAGFLVGLGKLLEREGGVIGMFEYLIVQIILLPLGQAIFQAIRSILAVFAIIIYGGNFRIGISGPEFVGLLDIPFLFSGPLREFVFEFGTQLTTSLVNINRAIAEPLANQLGIASPPLTATFWVFEMLFIAWGLWLIVRSVDIPFINPTGAFLALTKPIRNIINRWFR